MSVEPESPQRPPGPVPVGNIGKPVAPQPVANLGKPIPPPVVANIVGPAAPPRMLEGAATSRRNAFPVFCEGCGERIQVNRSATPFKDGPYKGGFVCNNCFVVYLDEHPEKTTAGERGRIAKEADAIRLQRATAHGELLFEEAEAKAWLTPRGTVFVELPRMPFGGPMDFDPDRFRTLMRMFAAVREKIPGYELEADHASV